MRELSSILVGLLLTGCVTSEGTNGGPYTNAAQIDYSLAKTSAKLSVEMTLLECPAEGLIVTPKVSIITKAIADPLHNYVIAGENLESFSKERSIDLKLNKNRTINSINGGITDKSGAIIVNTLKFIGSVVTFGAFGVPDKLPDLPPQTRCTQETKEVVTLRNTLKSNLATIRSKLPEAKPEEIKDIRETINIYATEIARLNNEKLRIRLEREISFGKPIDVKQTTRQEIIWKSKEFKIWTGNIDETEHKDHRLIIGIEKINKDTKIMDKVECPSGDTECSQTLVFREPETANVSVFVAGEGFKDEAGKSMKIGDEKRLAKAKVPVSQWGEFSYIPLTASFGEGKSFGINLDAYGRKTAFSWKSNARGESISGSLAGIASGVSDLAGNFEGKSEIEVAESEIKALETQQKLNKLRRCEEIINEGGFNCPTE